MAHPVQQWNQTSTAHTSWWQALIVLPWCIGLGLLLYGSFEDREIAKRQRTTTGRITSHEPANHNRYGYTFAVDGQQYSGWEIPKHDREIGASVSVYYDPLNPSRNALSDFSAVAVENTGVIPLVAVAIGLLALIIYLRRRENAADLPRSR